MAYHQPFQVIGFHSCDKEVEIKVLNGDLELKPSDNLWDWLGGGGSWTGKVKRTKQIWYCPKRFCWRQGGPFRIQLQHEEPHRSLRDQPRNDKRIFFASAAWGVQSLLKKRLYSQGGGVTMGVYDKIWLCSKDNSDDFYHCADHSHRKICAIKRFRIGTRSN